MKRQLNSCKGKIKNERLYKYIFKALNIFDMSSCKNDDEIKSKDSLEIIDHYTISKIS